MKTFILLALFFSFTVMISTATACGWFTYEDIKDTRAYYNAYDVLDGVEDSTLLVSRYPFELETKMNVYIPMSPNG